jgi:ubiquinone/menaquinone biosynthesis C-methylase UbiE
MFSYKELKANWNLKDPKSSRRRDLIKQYVQDGDTVLDIGCGSMLFLKSIADIKAIKPTGIDVIDINKTDLPFYRYDGQHVPFDNGSFDTVLICLVLHHIPYANQATVIKEALRVTKKRLIIVEEVYSTSAEKIWLKINDKLGNITEPTMHMDYSFRTKADWLSMLQIERTKNIEVLEYIERLNFSRVVTFVLTKL